jgi:hypothetical protein
VEETKLIRGPVPSNSDNIKLSSDDSAAKPVVKQRAKIRKKSPGSKILKSFLGDVEMDAIRDYLFHDVIVPSVKSVVTEFVNSALEMTLYGETRGRRSSSGFIQREGNRSYIEYGGMFSNSASPERRKSPRRSTFDLDSLIFASRPDAENVLAELVSSLRTYESVSVGTLYELCALESSHNYYGWGWYDLRDASVLRIRQGYILDLPSPVRLD